MPRTFRELDASLSWRRGDYEISTETSRLDIDAIWGFLRTAYWSEAIPKSVVARSIRHSLNFGLYHGSSQVGYARVVTDYATFAYLGDVFVLPPHGGRGLGTWLVETVLAHPEVKGLRRWMLATRDAHGLYARFGFKSLSAPERIMAIEDLDIYKRASEARATADEAE